MKSNPPKPANETSELAQALQTLRTPVRRVLGFGLVTNLLILMPTLYMLEVYGRVVNSRSSATLLMLTILVIAAYIVLEVLEWVRASLLHSGARAIDAKLAPRLFEASFSHALKRIPGAPPNALGDWATLRNFLASPAMLGLLDAPFALLFILLVFFISPWLGSTALLGGLFLLGIGALTEKGTRKPLAEANRSAQEATHYANGVLRNAQAVEAMGMLDRVHALWNERQQKFLVQQAAASDQAGVGSAGSKLIQTLQSSLLLGLGCWLTLQGDIDPTGGMMIVASVLGARALAPMAMVIGQWRSVVQAREARARLEQFLQALPVAQPAMPLPPPKGVLQCDNLSVVAPGTQTVLLRGVQCMLQPGEVLGIVGPSGAGKTTLARLLVGLWPATTGKVRLDGVDVFAWNKAELGPHIGFLSQAVELFDGTIAENIARFGEVGPAKVEAAARLVGLHEHIAALPQGYDTPIGVDGAVLSGGQRQRVGLARALYGDPQFVVLDEPNSSLDEAGEVALLSCLQQLKSRRATVVVITHRTNLLTAVDKLLIIRDGQMQAFGPRDEVLAAIKQAVEAARQGKPATVPGNAGLRVSPQGGAA